MSTPIEDARLSERDAIIKQHEKEAAQVSMAVTQHSSASQDRAADNSDTAKGLAGGQGKVAMPRTSGDK